MRCLLLTFDCLPRRWIGCYGSLDSTTRGFDRLAAVGTIFDNAISPDVRPAAAAIAGFHLAGPGQILAGVQSVPFSSQFFPASEESSGRSKAHKRSRSRLTQTLHQASSWMREQNGPCLAWVRHPGLRLAPEPLSAAADVETVLEQQAVIDEELDAFLDEWLDCADERWTFLLTSGRGVLRTRPTIRRRAEQTPSISDDLARVPLLALEGRGVGFGRRRLDLLPTTAVAASIVSGEAGDSTGLVARLETLPGVESVCIQADERAVAIRSADWLFVRSIAPDREAGDGQLYRKPEDACDVFDVRSTQADEAVRLDSLIEA
ncbi:hypothetical protein Pan44_02930 [Caulifigura coniformis]|uniref:Sulfatase n=1 Tax=Caulifigura coniformis TaxID=2527983 RepID=A0A517S831_9PLAN|nr:hypothetical protein [Caulifigura coniformis]QDT52284.1 hypothetical protein Pan44_02930 [Caulifigura coniformis]